jgi:hypothetical protein
MVKGTFSEYVQSVLKFFRWDLVSYPKLWDEYSDQLAPYDLFGKSEENGFFNGTLVSLGSANLVASGLFRLFLIVVV